ncbi:MAG: ATP-binding protein [Bacteroidales bacterium]|nr:ATP-binding protein [Bacteroidales bacterium]
MEKEENIKSLKLQNKLEELETISVFLEELAEIWDIPLALTMSLNLVLEEAFTNVVNYAYTDQDLHSIGIDFEKTGNILSIKIIDDGKAYDPTQNADPDVTLSAEERSIGGLGIFLIRKMMDEVTYQRADNKNILMMTKKLTFGS